MPIYEYVAEQCGRQPACSRRREYLQALAGQPLTACRECGAPIRRIFSSFAARSGDTGVSSPDPTPLNITGMAPPPGTTANSDSEGGCSDGRSHEQSTDRREA
ncbi:MAG: FmdB family zinc ribbon protein [Nitrospiraceae bacterium]